MPLHWVTISDVEAVVKDLPEDPYYIKLVPEYLRDHQDAVVDDCFIVDDPEEAPVVAGFDTHIPLEWKDHITCLSAEAGAQSRFHLQQLESTLATAKKFLVPTCLSGNCLFESILLQVDNKANFTPRALRRQVCMFMALHPELIFDHQALLTIASNYPVGELLPDGVCLMEALNVATYIGLMLLDSVWGDDLILKALSLMWNCSITIVTQDAHTGQCLEHRMRHGVSLEDCDFTLVFNGKDHYSAACLISGDRVPIQFGRCFGKRYGKRSAVDPTELQQLEKKGAFLGGLQARIIKASVSKKPEATVVEEAPGPVPALVPVPVPVSNQVEFDLINTRFDTVESLIKSTLEKESPIVKEVVKEIEVVKEVVVEVSTGGTPLPEGALQCSRCSKKFSAPHKTLEHFNFQHLGLPTKHQCCYCSKYFSSAPGLSRHKSVHNPKDISCEHCPKLFGSISMLNRHMKSVHPTAEEGTDEERRCPHCKEVPSVYMAASLAHRTKCVERAYPCPVEGCTASYLRKKTLKRHIKETHPVLEAATAGAPAP